MTTFIIDCPSCRAKVAATQEAVVERSGYDDETDEPHAMRVYVGACPQCDTLLVGRSAQTAFADFDGPDDEWSDTVRVYPKPPKTFASRRIPRVVTDSLREADRSLQASANIAACVMLGRALEAVCMDILEEKPTKDLADQTGSKPRRLTLALGIKELHEKGVIDARLLEWSQQLHAFRNLAAHPEDITISRTDAEDLQSFVYAIVEYVYDLADRYEDFKSRKRRHEEKSKTT